MPPSPFVHWTHTGARADAHAPAQVLVEVPHAAWRRAHYDAVFNELRGSLPDQLEHFFHFNTDVGAEHLALAIAEGLVARDARLKVELLLCRVPRTFVDCNRLVDAGGGDLLKGGLTPGLQPYIEDPADQTVLRGLHEAYDRAATEAHDRVCGSGGLALMPHTYAPRTVGVDRIDADIVKNLHACWEQPERWPLRPELDLITRTPDGELLADPEVVAHVIRATEALGLEVVEGGMYNLHPVTTAYAHARRHPGKTLCFEVRRDLLTHWRPFDEQTIDHPAVHHLAGPFVDAVLAALQRRSA